MWYLANNFKSMNISPYKKNNLVLNLAFEFALEAIVYTELLESMKKFNMANQLFKSATSIHANIREAQNAESKADFVHKMKISAKEADETEGWLQLCHYSSSYPNTDSLLEKLASILKLLNKIIGTTKRGISQSANLPIS
jgi:four helix bundle protein